MRESHIVIWIIPVQRIQYSDDDVARVCTLLNAKCYELHGIDDTRAILVPFHGILYCYDIPRYIVTLAILVS